MPPNQHHDKKALPQHFMRQGFGIGYSNGLKLIPFSWA